MVSEVFNALRPILRAIDPQAKLYFTEMAQGAKLPCFYLLAPLLSVDAALGEDRRREALIQVVYLPSPRLADPGQETRRVLGELLPAIARVETSFGSITPREAQGSAGGERCTLQFSIRWRVRAIDAAPTIRQENTEGVVNQ